MPLKVKWTTFRDRRRHHEPTIAQQAERWWSTVGNALRDLQAFGGYHPPSTKFLNTCGRELADQPGFCFGQESEFLAWRFALACPAQYPDEMSNLRLAAGVQRKEFAAQLRKE